MCTMAFKTISAMAPPRHWVLAALPPVPGYPAMHPSPSASNPPMTRWGRPTARVQQRTAARSLPHPASRGTPWPGRGKQAWMDAHSTPPPPQAVEGWTKLFKLFLGLFSKCLDCATINSACVALFGEKTVKWNKKKQEGKTRTRLSILHPFSSQKNAWVVLVVFLVFSISNDLPFTTSGRRTTALRSSTVSGSGEGIKRLEAASVGFQPIFQR